MGAKGRASSLSGQGVDCKSISGSCAGIETLEARRRLAMPLGRRCVMILRDLGRNTQGGIVLVVGSCWYEPLVLVLQIL